MPSINKESLAREIETVLELPYNGRWGKAYKIVQAIFQTMTQALKTGQTIKVDGLGIFEVRERAPTKCMVSYFYGIKTHTPYRELINLPTKRYIIFKPSKPFQKLVNGVSNGNT